MTIMQEQPEARCIDRIWGGSDTKFTAIAIGSNLPVAGLGGPLSVANAAVRALDAAGIHVVQRSRWYWSEPVPPALQPLFVNGVVLAHTERSPASVLQTLLSIEETFGRVRTAVNQARPLDLDLLCCGERILHVIDPRLIVPHPRLHQRAFVLHPLCDVWPAWRHPVLSLSVRDMLSRLDDEQWVQPIAD